MRSILLEVTRFHTPHNAKTTSKLLMNIIYKWKITSKINAVTSDNAKDMCASMDLVTRESLFSKNHQSPFLMCTSDALPI